MVTRVLVYIHVGVIQAQAEQAAVISDITSSMMMMVMLCLILVDCLLWLYDCMMIAVIANVL